jgi:hypothetical protein
MDFLDIALQQPHQQDHTFTSATGAQRYACTGNFFNMIYRVLTQFIQNPDKNKDFKELKLLTVSILNVYKDQLINLK